VAKLGWCRRHNAIVSCRKECGKAVHPKRRRILDWMREAASDTEEGVDEQTPKVKMNRQIFSSSVILVTSASLHLKFSWQVRAGSHRVPILRDTSHMSHEIVRAQKTCPNTVPRHFQNHVVWSRALKCSVRSYYIACDLPKQIFSLNFSIMS
jgi:hypothetical protein